MASRLYEIPQWGGATLVEGVWLLSGLIAVLICLRHIAPLWRDWSATKSRDDIVLRITAWSYLRREIIRICQGGAIVGLGLYTALVPPATPGPALISIVGIVLTATLLAVNFGVSLMSWWDWHDRSRVQDELRRENGQA